MSTFTNDFSYEVWRSKYKWDREDSIEDTWKRIAKDLAAVEENPEIWEESFYSILEHFQFIPGGRIISNAGTKLKGTSYINCFTDAFEGEDQDSIEGIYTALLRQAQILKSEGGYGFCCDVMRPRGTHIAGIGNQTPGAVKFLELWDKSSEIITAGSGKANSEDEKQSIRKGAQLTSMSCWHPDIVEFITAKQTPGRLTKFNMSVLCTDLFMQAVINNQPWQLVYPNIKKYKRLYKKFWNGNLQEWIDIVYGKKNTIWSESDEILTIYHTFESARELWDLIMDSTYNRNEPGVLFVDTINRMNNLHYCEHISASNPCLVRGTLVDTPGGPTPVEEIRSGDIVCTALGFEQVDNVETSVVDTLYRVKFSDGDEQITTANHQYFVTKGGSHSKEVKPIKVRHLSKGDKVRVIPSLFINTDRNMDEYNNGLKAGILLGDGCYTEKSTRIKIATNKDDTEYNKRVKNLFGSKNFNSDDLSTNSKSMSLILKNKAVDIESFGLQPAYSHEKNIDYRRINNFSFALGLLDGLLATDGNVNLTTNHPQLRWFTTSYELAKTIRRTLLYLGCHGVITKSHDKGGCIDGREILRKHSKYTINVSGESFRTYGILTQLQSIHPVKGKKINKARINFRLTGNVWYACVKSIEMLDKGDLVYDLYCQESDTWLTSGYTNRGCGEQPLDRGVCLLGSINLTQFIDTENQDWKYEELEQVINIAVRMMDNVNDITYVTLDVHKKALQDKRRIGLGVIGYASALMMARIKYGSKKALRLTEKLMEFFANKVYQASTYLSKEKGSFKLYDPTLYLAGEFVKKLSDRTRLMIKQNGMRNSHGTSMQPTGNTAVLANIISSGIEPIFANGYYRTAILHTIPEGLKLPEHVDWVNKTAKEEHGWKWHKEGDENVLFITLDNKVYKFDQNRGLCQEIWVEDYAITWLKEQLLWDENADWNITAMDLTIDDHVNTMKIFANWVDASISKTINLPNDYPYEDFKDVYIDAWKSGIKGITTYRVGTMPTVLSESSVVDEEDKIPKTTAPKRPKELECDVHHTSVKGKQYFVLVGLYDGDPYEVFAGINGHIDKKNKKGTIIKVRRNKYKCILEDGDDFCPINFSCDEHEDAVTRLTSTGLRHGADVQFIVHQLEKNVGDLQSFSKAIARALKKYIPDGTKEQGLCPDCEKESLIRQEGCVLCISCGYSKCI